MSDKIRCFGTGIPIYEEYHDTVWGRPVHDDRQLFEKLILDGAQAGLSWITILKKTENYRAAFDNFDAAKIAQYDEKKVEKLMQNAGIVRNRLKILAAIANAKAFLKVVETYGSFDKFLWDYVGGKPIQNNIEKSEDYQAKTPLSDKISKDLQKFGFKFVGSTIIYAFMQAVGMVNDHIKTCCVYDEVRELGK
ncbi:MAG: DNA-3-methyladenine glycosylase I [Firmicutes bacterium]|nr:DNA-3-methyladenine glycosylase I [Bacillota bacterium]